MANLQSVLPLLQCPVSAQHLHRASDAECGRIANALALTDCQPPAGDCANRASDGANDIPGAVTKCPEPNLEPMEFLITSDGRYAYPIQSGIPMLVADQCIRLGD